MDTTSQLSRDDEGSSSQENQSGRSNHDSINIQESDKTSLLPKKPEGKDHELPNSESSSAAVPSQRLLPKEGDQAPPSGISSSPKSTNTGSLQDSSASKNQEPHIQHNPPSPVAGTGNVTAQQKDEDKAKNNSKEPEKQTKHDKTKRPAFLRRGLIPKTKIDNGHNLEEKRDTTAKDIKDIEEKGTAETKQDEKKIKTPWGLKKRNQKIEKKDKKTSQQEQNLEEIEAQKKADETGRTHTDAASDAGAPQEGRGTSLGEEEQGDEIEMSNLGNQGGANETGRASTNAVSDAGSPQGNGQTRLVSSNIDRESLTPKPTRNSRLTYFWRKLTAHDVIVGDWEQNLNQISKQTSGFEYHLSRWFTFLSVVVCWTTILFLIGFGIIPVFAGTVLTAAFSFTQSATLKLWKRLHRREIVQCFHGVYRTTGHYVKVSILLGFLIAGNAVICYFGFTAAHAATWYYHP